MKANIPRYKIRFVSTWPTDEIVDLYKIGGWWKKSYSSSHLLQLIAQSFVFAIVYDTREKKAVGMGRVLSDGMSDAYIQDFVIHPDHRRKGLGKELLTMLIDYCHQHKITWIAIIAEPNSHTFYRKNGFSEMKDHTPMQYHFEG